MLIQEAIGQPRKQY